MLLRVCRAVEECLECDLLHRNKQESVFLGMPSQPLARLPQASGVGLCSPCLSVLFEISGNAHGVHNNKYLQRGALCC